MEKPVIGYVLEEGRVGKADGVAVIDSVDLGCLE